MDFSLMETEDLEILLKITEIDIKLAEFQETQRKANRKRRRRIRVQWTRDWIVGELYLILQSSNAEDDMKLPRSSLAL